MASLVDASLTHAGAAWMALVVNAPMTLAEADALGSILRLQGLSQ